MLKRSVLALSLTLGSLAHAGVTVDYWDGKTPLQGYLSGSELKGKRPGVLIVHQWMGLTDYEKGRADQLTRELGVVAFAADIYGKGVRAKDTQEAAALAGKYKADRALYQERVTAGLQKLASLPNVDPHKIAVIGYCFGGMGALDQARLNAPVLGVVSFHGSLEPLSPEVNTVFKPKILVLHGADDPFENAASVAALKRELDAAHADYKVILYKGAVHAFTQPLAGNDPSKGVAYNAAADKASWLAMKKFLTKLF